MTIAVQCKDLSARKVKCGQHREKISVYPSLIIPVHDDMENLCSLLTAVMSRLSLGEIIVVDGGDQKLCQQAAKQFPHIRYLQSNKGRGLQIDTGVRSATSDYIWVLHADSQIPETPIDEINEILGNPRVSFGCFRLKFDVHHPLLKLFSYISRYDSPFTTFGDQGYFFRRTDYLKCGGVADFPLLEDVALRRLILNTHPGLVIKSHKPLSTSAHRFIKNGVIKTQLFNFWILIRYFAGVSVEKLYTEYYR